MMYLEITCYDDGLPAPQHLAEPLTHLTRNVLCVPFLQAGSQGHAWAGVAGRVHIYPGYGTRLAGTGEPYLSRVFLQPRLPMILIPYYEPHLSLFPSILMQLLVHYYLC